MKALRGPSDSLVQSVPYIFAGLAVGTVTNVRAVDTDADLLDAVRRNLAGRDEELAQEIADNEPWTRS